MIRHCCDGNVAFLAKLYEKFSKTKERNKDQLNDIIEETNTEERLFDFIAEFFNNTLPFPAMKDKAGERSHQKYLLYLDNSEELITHNWKKGFSLWLSKILEECNTLSIVMTSKKGILPNELSKLSIPPEV